MIFWVVLVLGERPGILTSLRGAVVLSPIAWRTLTAGPPAAEGAPPD